MKFNNVYTGLVAMLFILCFKIPLSSSSWEVFGIFWEKCDQYIVMKPITWTRHEITLMNNSTTSFFFDESSIYFERLYCAYYTRGRVSTKTWFESRDGEDQGSERLGADQSSLRSGSEQKILKVARSVKERSSLCDPQGARGSAPLRNPLRKKSIWGPSEFRKWAFMLAFLYVSSYQKNSDKTEEVACDHSYTLNWCKFTCWQPIKIVFVFKFICFCNTQCAVLRSGLRSGSEQIRW